MSQYKTPKTKRQQDMMLHVLGINDMKVEKWLQFFTDDEINWMLNTEEGMTVASRHPLETSKVLQTLRDKLEGVVLEAPQRTSGNIYGHPLQPIRVSTDSPIQRHSQAPVATVNSLPYMVETDKGEFYAINQVMSRLEPLYNIDNFSEIFYQSMVDIGISPDIQYISTSKKKGLVSKLKQLAKKRLDDLSEEL